MIKHWVAIGFIFICTSVAWMVLAGATTTRTYYADKSLRKQVESVWGAPQVQQPPALVGKQKVTRKVESLVDGKKKVDLVEEEVTHPVALRGSRIKAVLGLDHRQKGLLWYATYSVEFEGIYEVVNETGVELTVTVALPFPARDAVFDDLRFELSGKEWLESPVPGNGKITGLVRLQPKEGVTLRTGYRSQGLGRWTYSFGPDVAEVHNFSLRMHTNFAEIDFPDGSISPARKERVGEGWMLVWEFRRLVSGVNIAVVMPEKLQPGPLASQIALFAPVSLFFFIVVMLTIGIVTRVQLHPMHFFFLSAAFFAFHLLFAYLADQVDIHAAFAVAAVTSLALVVSYLRVVFGARFAFFAAGGAQLLYLVLFSYAFFIKGLTGLAITIGAIVTLFVLMQATARIRWNEVFAARQVGTGSAAAPS